MKALEYPKVFKILLDGGYIVVAESKKRTTYLVVTGTVAMVGHITEKMARALMENEVIVHHEEKDQWGVNSWYSYWGLNV